MKSRILGARLIFPGRLTATHFNRTLEAVSGFRSLRIRQRQFNRYQIYQLLPNIFDLKAIVWLDFRSAETAVFSCRRWLDPVDQLDCMLLRNNYRILCSCFPLLTYISEVEFINIIRNECVARKPVCQRMITGIADEGDTGHRQMIIVLESASLEGTDVNVQPNII